MLGNDYDDIERDGGGCSFGCTCRACNYDEDLVENDVRYSKYKSDEKYGYTYKPDNK